MKAGPTRPDARGWFGPWGGRFVPETLMAPLAALDRAYRTALRDRRFRSEFDRLLRLYAGRPTPLYPAERLSDRLGARVYLKREDLLHTGAHKINNTIGQALLARRMGKTRLIAETGAGQHGVATATVAARFGMACTVYMGVVDMARQRPNVERMRLLGAEVVGVDAGSRTLKDAINEALRDWVAHSRTTHYVLGSVLGPAPYPEMIRTFHRSIGREARRQILAAERRLPDLLVACVGGGSNAAGLFYDFLKDRRVRMVGVEAGGVGDSLGAHAARFSARGGAPGVLHGTRTVLLQDAAGNVAETRSVSAGLDYPAVGPEHALWRDLRRVSYARVRDREALAAFHLLGETEGILPALESAHAVAYVVREARRLKGRLVVVNLSGRGDKDLETVLNR